jgi:hypothetical protein
MTLLGLSTTGDYALEGFRQWRFLLWTVVLVIKLAETTGKRRSDTAKKKEPV